MVARLGQHESPTWTTLGGRIRLLRHERGWTQEKLAMEMGCLHVQSVSRVELGKVFPSADFLGRMALAFGFADIGEFLAGVKSEDLTR